jgi:hypothetical protein
VGIRELEVTRSSFVVTLHESCVYNRVSKHVEIYGAFAKDESSILSTSNLNQGFSFTTEAFFLETYNQDFISKNSTAQSPITQYLRTRLDGTAVKTI